MDKSMTVNDLIFFLKDFRKRCKGANGNEIRITMTTMSHILNDWGDTNNDDGTITINQKRVDAENEVNNAKKQAV